MLKLKYKVIIFIGILLIVIVVGSPKIFGNLQPIRSIEIFSENLNYQNREPGAWKVTKSARWTKHGEAEITIDIDSVLKTNEYATDILFVLDISGSMEGERLERVKSDAGELIERLLSNDKNRAGLITFDTDSEIVSDLINDKNFLMEKINALVSRGCTNYYRALVDISTILKSYTKEDNREFVVLFLTNGSPNEDTPNEVAQYNYLKRQYPYLKINAIQYEMGTQILDEIKKVSDNQFVADMKTLNNVLFEASNIPVKFDDFRVTDYVDTNYFYVEDEKSINVSQGKVSFDKSNQKIDWILDNYKSGSKATMSIKTKLREDLDDNWKIYSTNEKEEVKSKIEEVLENITSKRSPVLADNYKVSYDGNTPSGCSTTVGTMAKNYSVFDTVVISDEVPVCNGYQFKGWKILTKDVEMVNDDYFIMPESDVEIKGTWSKLDIKKSMDGAITESLTMYKQVQEDFDNPNKYVRKYTGDTSTFNGDEDVYYYYGEAANNNVVFANYCWKIVRTTDTGGVKLLYNGVPSAEGKCNNTGGDSLLTAEDMNLNTNMILFNEKRYSPSDVGYMYNKSSRYESKYKEDLSQVIISSNPPVEFENWYYADRISYFDGYYLENPEQYSWADNFEYLVGKYTFQRPFVDYGSPNVYYIVNAEEDRMDYIEFRDGRGVSNIEYELTITLSQSINDNGDGTYTLGSPFTLDKKDWRMDLSWCEGYYTCGNNELTCEKSEMKYITNITETEMYYVTMNDTKRYGNSFEWDGVNYKLKDTIDVLNNHEFNALNNYHYTCFNIEGICKNVSYIYHVDTYTTQIHYIDLSDGKSVDDVLDEMLYGENVNKDSSNIKNVIDYWYYNNMKDFTSYLEDTVWCNNRFMNYEGANGWNPNGGIMNSDLFFYSSNNVDLICQNKNDRFTVSSENGNGALTYPVGLITKQEQGLAFSSGKSPLASGSSYWGLSPGFFSYHYGAVKYAVGRTGDVEYLYNFFGVRPAISLRAGVLYKTGDGSTDFPYVILTD